MTGAGKPEGHSRDWVDLISKLLLPIVIFGVGLYFTYQRDRSDRANQEFERDSSVLKLAASSNDAERTLGLKIIEALQHEGKWSNELRPVVDAISKGRPSDPSTQTARNILAAAPKQDSPPGTSASPIAPSQAKTVYVQIAREDQRAEAHELSEKLKAIGLAVEGIELVKAGTVNTYIRYFSADDKSQADKILQVMKDMKFNVEEQNFLRFNLNHTSSGQLEVWIGDRHVSPSQP